MQKQKSIQAEFEAAVRQGLTDEQAVAFAALPAWLRRITPLGSEH